MKFFKSILIGALTVIMVLLAAITFKLYYPFANGQNDSPKKGEYKVVCIINNKAYGNGYMPRHSHFAGERVYSSNEPTYMDRMKKFIHSRRLKFLFINDSTLQIFTFRSRDMANSFTIELDQYYGEEISKCYVSE